MTRPTTAEIIRWIVELETVIASDLATSDERSHAAHDRDNHVWGLSLRAEEGDRDAAAFLACESNHADLYFDPDTYADERRNGDRS